MGVTDVAVPAGLGSGGRAFWRSVTGTYEGLMPGEVALLTQVCRTLDTIAGLEKAVKADGPMSIGSMGQPVLHPAVGEVRQQRLVLVRLLDQLGLPAEDVDAAGGGGRGLSVVPESAASRRARRAAVARWGRRSA